MKAGERIFLESSDLKAALASGLVEPQGVDVLGETVYLVTRAGARLSKSVPIRAAGILLVHEATQTVLLVRRAAWVREPGTWCIPGGALELGESAWAGAQRELFVETGLSLEGCSVQKEVLLEHGGVAFTTFVVTCSERGAPCLNEEHTAHVWLGFEQLHSVRDKLHSGFQEFLKF